MSKLIFLALTILAVVKVAQLSIDTTDLDGDWNTTFFYNYTYSKIVARMCSTQNGLKSTISGSEWVLNTDNADPKKDLMFNSDGIWTIKEVIRGDNINFVKVEVDKNSGGLLEGILGGLLGDLLGGTEKITACFAYMRAENQLLTMLNYTDPEYCPNKFVYFDEVCSNMISYTVSDCTGGKCATSAN